MMSDPCFNCGGHATDGYRRRGLCQPCYYDLSVRVLFPCRRGALAAPRGLCRHCGRTAAVRPRDLCWTCYYDMTIRDLYPPTSKYARKGHGQTGSLRLPDAPTAALPGSEEKLAVLEERARLGVLLFHPGDARDPELRNLGVA